VVLDEVGGGGVLAAARWSGQSDQHAHVSYMSAERR
jgi:hypothetical protein